MVCVPSETETRRNLDRALRGIGRGGAERIAAVEVLQLGLHYILRRPARDGIVHRLRLVDVELQDITLGECDGKRLSARDRDGRLAVGQREDHRIVRLLHAGEDRIAARDARIALVARSLPQLLPALTVVIGDMPIAALDLELRRRAGSTVVGRRGNPVTVVIGQRLAVDRPVVDFIDLLDPHHGRGALVALLAVVDRHRLALGKRNGVAHRFAALHDGNDARYIVVLLQGLHEGLQRRNVGVHPLTQLFKLFDPIFETVNTATQGRIIVVVATRPHPDDRCQQEKKFLHTF